MLQEEKRKNQLYFSVATTTHTRCDAQRCGAGARLMRMWQLWLRWSGPTAVAVGVVAAAAAAPISEGWKIFNFSFGLPAAQLQKFSYCALSLAALLCCFLGTLHNFHFNGDVDVCCCCCSPQRSRAHLAYCACVFSFSLYWFFLWARHESVGFFFSFDPLAYPPPWKLPAAANIAFLFVLRPLEASCISRFA